MDKNTNTDLEYVIQVISRNIQLCSSKKQESIGICNKFSKLLHPWDIPKKNEKLNTESDEKAPMLSERELMTLSEADKILAKAAKTLADKTAEEERLLELQRRKEKLDRVLQTKELLKPEKPVKPTKAIELKPHKPVSEKTKAPLSTRTLSSNSQKGNQVKTAPVPTYKTAPFKTDVETKRKVLKAHNTKTSLARQKLTRSATIQTKQSLVKETQQALSSLSVDETVTSETPTIDSNQKEETIPCQPHIANKKNEKGKNTEINENTKRFNIMKEGNNLKLPQNVQRLARLNRKFQKQIRDVRKKLANNPQPSFITNLEKTVFYNSDNRLKRLLNVQQTTTRYTNLFSTLEEASAARNWKQVPLDEKLSICKAYQAICKEFENLTEAYTKFITVQKKSLNVYSTVNEKALKNLKAVGTLFKIPRAVSYKNIREVHEYISILCDYKTIKYPSPKEWKAG
ncbi:DgyrCDS7271 [Dimorphilus gyrociliatus]|uniref:DgyrCDS7271 n=1 Tax=Dimorphilus gyrociliatus TaxID=2664684 RepID=A0A7I8VQL6_9ANNE|nr:DgyrCDS7271 [Dimorphilus gyrociliatus]